MGDWGQSLPDTNPEQFLNAVTLKQPAFAHRVSAIRLGCVIDLVEMMQASNRYDQQDIDDFLAALPKHNPAEITVMYHKYRQEMARLKAMAIWIRCNHTSQLTRTDIKNLQQHLTTLCEAVSLPW